MASQEEEKLYADFYETVVLPYVAYKTTRNERKAGTRNDWKSGHCGIHGGHIISGSICRIGTRRATRR
jgi:hypothetical protein